MTEYQKIKWLSATLILAAGMSLGCRAASAEPDTSTSIEQNSQDTQNIQNEQDVLSSQNDMPAAADSNVQAEESPPADASDTPDSTAQDDKAKSEENAKPNEQQTRHAESRILSSNPDDANKAPAWRKRDADKEKVNLPALRRSMMQQAGP